MAGCGICKVTHGDPAKTKWALRHESGVVSFKPFGASKKGHRMFVPIEHIVDAAEDPEITGKCFAEAARWGKAKGVPFNLIVNSGAEAGQGTFHLHVHYMPREQGDGLGYRWNAGWG